MSAKADTWPKATERAISIACPLIAWATGLVLTVLLALVILPSGPARAQAAPPTTTATTAIVDPAIPYQTFQGWGVSLAWWAKVVGGFPEPARSDYMDKAFDPVKGLGLNIVRYNIGGGENPAHLLPNKQFMGFREVVPGFQPSPGQWDWTADANQRWVLQRAIKMGANRLEAFSNSPPYWMTRSGSVTGMPDGSDNLDPKFDQPFADYLTTVVQHFHDAWGITFDTLEPLNEPSGSWWKMGNHQEGCHVDRPHQNIVAKLTGQALARKKLRTALSASDESVVADADKTYEFYDDTTRKLIRRVNTHSYGGGDRVQLWNSALTHNQDLWLSEYGDGDASGLQMSRQIVTDLNGLHPTAWVYWQVVDNAGGWGFLRNPLTDETNTAYVVNKKFYVMGQYSKYIRPGFQFLAITEPNSVAAYDAHNRTLVIVTTNSADTPAPIDYDLSRFTRLGSSVTAYRTSPTEDGARLPALPLTGKRLATVAPPRSVTTFVIPGVAYNGPHGFDYRASVRLVNAAGQAAGTGPDESWGLVGVGDDVYKIINRRSGLVLDVNQSSTEPGASVLQYGDNGGDNQRWRLVSVGKGLYQIVNHHSGLTLAPSPAGLTQQTDNGAPAQRWRIIPVGQAGR